MGWSKFQIQTVGKLSDTLSEVTLVAKRELLGIFAKWKSEKHD